MLKIKLGIIAALPFEAACFTHNKIHPGTYQVFAENSYVFYAGMGPDHATRAAEKLVELDVDAFVSWGVAASLDPKLVSGDIILPMEVLDIDGALYQVNHDWHTALTNKLKHPCVYSGGRLVSTHDVQHSAQQKTEIRQATQATVLDMESAAVAKVALRENKPFVVIRSIFDTVAMQIPASSTNATDEYGQTSIRKLIIGLLKNPAELLHYPKLINSFSKAKTSLQRVVNLCGNELCFSKSL